MDVARFWARVERSDPRGCWIWMGRVNSYGYGQLMSWWKSSPVHPMVHRVAYELLVGEIPPGLQLDHLCRNRLCVNPAHLEPVTAGENVRRGKTGQVRGAQQRARTHCIHGHEFSADNTRRSGPRDHRHCRICDREGQRRRRAAAKEIW